MAGEGNGERQDQKGPGSQGPAARPTGPGLGRVLDVSYKEHQDAKKVGARFDGAVWWAPPGSHLDLFQRWFPATKERERELLAKSGAHRGSARRCFALNAQGIFPKTHNAPLFEGTWAQRGGGVEWVVPKGVRHGVWLSRPPASIARVVVVERALDALSYHQLWPHERTLYVALGKGRRELTPEQDAFLKANVRVERPPAVVAAFSNSSDGAALCRGLTAAVAPLGVKVERNAPTCGIWWNDTVLTMQRDYIRGVCARRREPSLARGG